MFCMKLVKISGHRTGGLRFTQEQKKRSGARKKIMLSIIRRTRKSINRIIYDMSGNKAPYKELFDKEFCELTAIGNNSRIRHHKTTKIDIEDNRHYEYFYKRCIS